MLEASAKRAIPARGQDDSPELHAIKRSKVEEVKDGGDTVLEYLAAATKRLESLRAGNPRKEVYNVQETSAYLDTDKVSEKRFSNMQKNLNRGTTRGPSLVGESNEDGSSCSGNENEDRDNALYDDRMVESDKKNLVDWQWQIKKIKQNDLPKHFLKQREEDLDNAQADFISSKKIPVYLEGVKQPWNQGTGQAIIRYNEMIIRKLERRIEKTRERNAALCTLEDAAKRTDGPSGQGKR
jgi:hypothetical protein